MICPRCGSGVVLKKGFSYTKNKPIAQRFICKECKKQFRARFQEDHTDLPKILLMDIETSLYHFVGWGTYKQYIQHHQVTKHQYIISWAAKWLFDKNVQGDIISTEEAFERDDEIWTANTYDIQSEIISSVLPSNQILRPYDNVPRYAKSLEISANRLIFGNYVQNYTLLNDLNQNVPIFTTSKLDIESLPKVCSGNSSLTSDIFSF